VSGTGVRYQCRLCGREAWREASCPGFDVTGEAAFDRSAPFAYLVFLADSHKPEMADVQ
jgi:hypothetical protein